MSAYIRLILDEVFGKSNFINEIIWHFIKGASGNDRFGRKHQVIFWYSRTLNNAIFNRDKIGVEYNAETIARAQRGEARYNATAEDLLERGKNPGDVWSDLHPIQGNSIENTRYPTQKPEALLERIIKASSDPGDIVFDCFMGSGTTQAVAMNLGRRFIGADINLGAVETTTKRLFMLAKKIHINTAQSKIGHKEEDGEDTNTLYTGFEVYNVNHYDVFRNPAEAKDLLIEALEIQPLPTAGIYDGEKDGRMVKIMPINRIATRADLSELITGFDYRAFQRRQEEHPTQPFRKVIIGLHGTRIWSRRCPEKRSPLQS